MAADAEFAKEVMQLLAPLGDISSRAMFGGFGIFSGGDMFALISGSALFFKVDDSNRAVYAEAGSAQYKPMPYYRVPPEVLSDRPTLHDWARASIAVAEAAPKKKRR